MGRIEDFLRTAFFLGRKSRGRKLELTFEMSVNGREGTGRHG